MKNTFYRPKEVNIPEFYSIVNKLREDLHELETMPVDKEEVTLYVSELMKQAMPLEHDPSLFAWGLSDPNTMPRDARVEFFYLPTYLATAFLMKASLLYPDLIKQDESVAPNPQSPASELKYVLRNAMRMCTGRDFDGADVLTLKETIEIFTNAGAGEFLNLYPKICPKFHHLFLKKKTMVERGELSEGELWLESFAP